MTVIFEERAGRTKLTFRQEFESTAVRDENRIGTASALEPREQYMATVHDRIELLNQFQGAENGCKQSCYSAR
jgi:hypothetical protein